MKRDIILTCEYTPENQRFFQKLKCCDLEELKEMVYPLFNDVCCLTFEKVEQVHLDECAFKGGFVALSFNINEENIPGSENMYHSDMITFLNIHKSEYNQDPEKQFVVLENAEHNQIFSTQVYPVFLEDIQETKLVNIDIQTQWALLFKLTASKKSLRKKLEKYDAIKKALKYR